MDSVSGRQPVQIVELDQDLCSLTFGESPCQASLGGLSQNKCHNTRATCADPDNYMRGDPLVIRFTRPQDSLPFEWRAIPSLESVSTIPTQINPGGGDRSRSPLGSRSRVQIELVDHPYSDAVTDPYRAERLTGEANFNNEGFDPYKRGTFWSKWLARNPFYTGRRLRVLEGYAGQDLEDMKARTYLITEIGGPSADGKVTIRADDILSLANPDKAQAPFATEGELKEAITATSDSIALLNVRDPAQYAEPQNEPEGFKTVRIGDEVIRYDSVIPDVEGDEPDFITDEVDSSPAENNGASGFIADGRQGLEFDGQEDHAVVTRLNESLVDELLGSIFTLEFWFYAKSTDVGYVFWAGQDDAPQRDEQTMSVLSIEGNLEFNAHGSSLTTPIEVGEWVHYAFATGAFSFIRLFKNGEQIDQTGAGPRNDGNNFGFGARSENDDFTEASVFFDGALSDVRLWDFIRSEDDIADNINTRFTGNESGLVALWSMLLDSDEFLLTGLTRGADGTEADEHDAEERVQVCLRYTETPVWKVVEDLLKTYAGVPEEFIPIDEWDAEGSEWLDQFNVSALIVEPEGVTDLLGELTEQCQFFVWWDEREQKIRLQAIRPPVEAPSEVDDRRNIIAGSWSVTTDLSQRVSQVWVYYLQRDPTEDLDDPTNYQRLRVRLDTDAESADEYDERRVKRIYSRWLRTGAQAINVSTRLLGRYRDGAKYIRFKLDAKDRDLWTADLCDVSLWSQTDALGNPQSRLYQIISAEEVRPGDIIEYNLLNYDFLAARNLFWQEEDAEPFDPSAPDEGRNGWWAGEDGTMSDGSEGFSWQ